jgi:hypothetical protein
MAYEAIYAGSALEFKLGKWMGDFFNGENL